MANKTIHQLTQLTVGTGLGTDEIPIFHDNSTYKTTKNELFEGLGSKTFNGLNTEVKTVTGAINEINENLNKWIVNKNPENPAPSEREGYYTRIGIDPDGTTIAGHSVAPFSYIDFKDANDTSVSSTGRVLSNLVLAGPQTEEEQELYNAVIVSKDLLSAKYFSSNPKLLASLADMIPVASVSQHHTITTVNQLDNELRPGWVYLTNVGVSLGLPQDYCVIYEYWYNTSYRFQIAQQVNIQTVNIFARSQYRTSGATTSSWGPWYTLAQRKNNAITITKGTGVGTTGWNSSLKNGIAFISFATTLAAGTYTGQSSVLFTTNIYPLHEIRFQMALPGNTGIAILKTNGTCVLNATLTTTSVGYIQGSVVYPY